MSLLRMKPSPVALLVLASIQLGCGNDRPVSEKPNNAPSQDVSRKPSPRADPVENAKVLHEPDLFEGAESARARLAKEDPEVVAYFKKRGWSLSAEPRLGDFKWMVFLVAKDRDKPFGPTTITPEDYQMIARSKAVEFLGLADVKNTDDEGLKVVATNAHLQAIFVNSEVVTDIGLKALARCKTLDFIYVRFGKRVTDAGVRELAALPKLQSLTLDFMSLNGSAFEAFADSKTLESVKLEAIDGFTDDGARQLAKLPNLNELRVSFGSGERKLTVAGIKAIVDARARVPAKFEFPNVFIDDDLLETLVAKGWLYGPTPPAMRKKRPATAAEVREIDLSGSKVTDRGLRALLSCTNAIFLGLGQTGATDETVKKLSLFKSLQFLVLDKTKVTSVGLEALAALPLRRLSMQHCDLSEDAFTALGRTLALKELWLDSARIKTDWVKHIAFLPKLTELSLAGTDFDDAGVKHLTSLPSLEVLRLTKTKLGDRGFQELVALPNLRSLSVDGTQVTKDVFFKAKKDRPKLHVY